MKVVKILTILAISAGLAFTGCKPKDADIQAGIEKKLKDNPLAANVTVSVTDAVATLTGEVKDAAAQSSVAQSAQDVRGVKSVTNNTTVAVAPAPSPSPAPVTIATDDMLSGSVTDATKDYPEIKATAANGVITVTGSITKDRWQKLKMALDGLKPKKVDGSALKIK